MSNPAPLMSLLITARSPTLDRPANSPVSTISTIMVRAPRRRNRRNRYIFSMVEILSILGLFRWAVQRGRNKRRGEASFCQYVEPLCAARTMRLSTSSSQDYS